ncbi:transaldolase [Stipitochalara longipes BDJ]|nr:transaldolase [Stipitochalara longipes BDJ]
MGSQPENALSALQDAGTVLIADTADLQLIEKFKPSEGTTNPSLLYTAAQNPAYSPLLARTIKYARSLNSSVSSQERVQLAAEYLAVQFGTEIYQLTGRVSTEVDVIHSFNTEATITAALRVISLYAAQGVTKEKVRIKISATWEGIKAASVLTKEHGISVLITIVFGMVQAITATEAGVACIAPYVGRISDWHKAQGITDGDKGVERVRDMQNYLRKYGYKTQVMGASFRNTDQVRQLAGTDLLTISPAVLELLEKEKGGFGPCLTSGSAQAADIPKVSYINDENSFRWAFNMDACAVEKSAEAMRKFAEDAKKLEGLLARML